MVRPKHYHQVNIHGLSSNFSTLTGPLQFHTSVAHVKEWPSLFKSRQMTYYHILPHDDQQAHNGTISSNSSSSMTEAIRRDGLLLPAEETGILHEAKDAFVPADRKRGLYRLHYDQDGLDSWIRGLMNRRMGQVQRSRDDLSASA